VDDDEIPATVLIAVMIGSASLWQQANPKPSSDRTAVR
jgi:hypothetical protein